MGKVAARRSRFCWLGRIQDIPSGLYEVQCCQSCWWQRFPACRSQQGKVILPLCCLWKIKLWPGSILSIQLLTNLPMPIIAKTILSSVSRMRTSFSCTVFAVSLMKPFHWAPRSRTAQRISSNQMLNTLLLLRPCWYACYKLLPSCGLPFILPTRLRW